MEGDEQFTQAVTEGASGNQRTDVRRQEPDTAEARAQLVEQWSKRVKQAKAHHEPAFKRMRKDMQFARGLQWLDQKSPDDERYVANLTLRHLHNKVAALYAKNPKAQAKRRKRLDYAVWDGDPQSLMQAQQTVAEAQQVVQQTGDPMVLQMPQVQQAQQLMEDVQRGHQHRQMIDRIGKTLEVVYEHQLEQQQPKFKAQMKQLVRRASTAGVGYIKLNYFREQEQSPEMAGRISDVRNQLALVEQRMEDLADDELHPHQAEAEELRATLDALQQQEGVFTREGLDLDFPSATAIIPDENCKQLDGFLGARWVAQEYLLTPEQIQQYYEVDVSHQFRPYEPPSENSTEGAQPVDSEPGSTAGGRGEGAGSEQEKKVCVWEVFDRNSGLVYHIADGYGDFLREPHAPYVKLERFFPFFVLTFNEIEDEHTLFPPSDVALMRPMQEEHNVSRQRLREHRDAVRPKHVAPRGKLTNEDKERLASGDAHSVVEVDGLQPGENIENVIQAVPHAPIDQNLYEVNQFFEDTLKAVGTHEAQMGGSSKSTATEASVAESTRQTSMDSNVDDLDEFLSELAQNAGYVLLTEMPQDKVQEIAGPGAVWPEVTAEEIARDLWLTVRAGSSGKPNRSQEIQNFERLAPILMQIPGIDPHWMAKEAIHRLDDRMDLEEAYVEGLPSITAQNHQAQPDQGEPGETQNDQADHGREGGADHSPAPPDNDANQGPNPAAQGAPQRPSRPVA